MTKYKKITIIAVVLIIILAIGFVISTGNLFAATADNKNIKITFSGEYKKSNENKIKTMLQMRLYIDKINKQTRSKKNEEKNTVNIDFGFDDALSALLLYGLQGQSYLCENLCERPRQRKRDKRNMGI